MVVQWNNMPLSTHVSSPITIVNRTGR